MRRTLSIISAFKPPTGSAYIRGFIKKTSVNSVHGRCVSVDIVNGHVNAQIYFNVNVNVIVNAIVNVNFNFNIIYFYFNINVNVNADDC